MIVIILAACSSEEPLTPSENSMPGYHEGNHVSVSEAMQRAGKMLDALDARQSITRSSAKHRIALDIDMEVITATSITAMDLM